MNFSRAAKMLNMSQPTLSYRILQLEEELGFKLVERQPKPRLTLAGQLFVEYCESILRTYDEMISVCSKASKNNEGKIVFEKPICFEATWQEIKNICLEFSKKYNIEIQFVETESTLNDVLDSDTADVGFIWTRSDFIEQGKDGFGYLKLPISQHPEIKFLMLRNNKLAEKQMISKDDLQGKKIVLPLSIRYSVFDNTLKNYMNHENIDINIVHKNGSYRDIELGLVNEEIAFGMNDLNRFDSLNDDTNIVLRPADLYTWKPEGYLKYKINNKNPALNTFFEHLKR